MNTTLFVCFFALVAVAFCAPEITYVEGSVEGGAVQMANEPASEVIVVIEEPIGGPYFNHWCCKHYGNNANPDDCGAYCACVKPSWYSKWQYQVIQCPKGLGYVAQIDECTYRPDCPNA